MEFTKNFLKDTSWIARNIEPLEIFSLICILNSIKKRGGRIFILGVGGSAATASHAVNDFRKICGMDAVSPLDNVAEITARINDDGWEKSLVGWLEGAKINPNDFVLFISVGGGDLERDVSVNLIKAMDLAVKKEVDTGCIVGRSEGYLYEHADYPVLIDVPDNDAITPYVESFHSVILHLIASHPMLKENQTKWESINE